MDERTRRLLLFIIPSSIGVLLFMVPINIVELFVIFLERTLISIVVVSLAAHIIF